MRAPDVRKAARVGVRLLLVTAVLAAVVAGTACSGPRDPLEGAYVVALVPVAKNPDATRLERWTLDGKRAAVIPGGALQLLDGRHVLQARAGAYYRVSTAAGGGRTRLGAIPAGGTDSGVVSRDGARVAIGGQNCDAQKPAPVFLRVADLRTGRVQAAVPVPRRGSDVLWAAFDSWSPDGRLAAFEVSYHDTECRAPTETDHSFYLLDVATRKISRLGESNGSVEYSVGAVFSPGGRYVAFPGPNGIVVRDLRSGSAHRVSPYSDTGNPDFIWASDTTLVHAWGSPVRATDVRTWRTHIVGRPDAHDASVNLVGISPDGTEVAYAAGFEPPWVIHVRRVDGTGRGVAIPAPPVYGGWDLRLVFP